jgi:hypothetical protein
VSVWRKSATLVETVKAGASPLESPAVHGVGSIKMGHSENHTLNDFLFLKRGFMADEHLIKVISKRYKTLSVEKRMVEIRKLARQSEANRDFLKQYFPEYYKEAYPNG